jgi:hypothetical protein
MEEPDTGNGTDGLEALRREAANWRHQLREAETERDGLRSRLDTVQRLEVERLASEHLVNGADLLLLVDLNDLRGDDGIISAEKAQAALEHVVTERPHFAKAAAPAAPEPGSHHPQVHGGARAPEPTPLSFGAELKAVRQS